MRTSRLTPLALALGLLAPVAVDVPAAHAAFPGTNGALAFQIEAPAGDHTQTDIYTIQPSGTGLQRLTATADEHEFGPAWNATGTRIAFWRTPAPFGPGSIWTMKPDGTDQRRLTADVDARDPAWCPSDTRIAFTLVGTEGFDLWTMRGSDGGDRRQVTAGPAVDFEPAWSPDGTRLAFTRGSMDGDPGDVYAIDLATGAVTQVTNSPEYDHQVAWSPDGRRLVFERDADASSSIYTVKVDGTALTRVTDGPFFDTGPAFSPDGRLIAFGSDRAGGFLADLWLVNSNGTGVRRVRDLPDSEGFPDWRPVRSG
jgi:Tol biopolymer transport system component